MEIQVWKTTCCLPELCYHTACFQRLNATNGGRKDKTGGKGGKNRAVAMQTEGRTAGQREGRRKEEQRREGAEKQEQVKQ